MKLSDKPRHYASRKKGMPAKNHAGHKSHGGAKTPSRAGNLAMEIVRMMFGALPRRTRRVFMEQERALNMQQHEERVLTEKSQLDEKLNKK